MTGKCNNVCVNHLGILCLEAIPPSPILRTHKRHNIELHCLLRIDFVEMVTIEKCIFLPRYEERLCKGLDVALVLHLEGNAERQECFHAVPPRVAFVKQLLCSP